MNTRLKFAIKYLLNTLYPELGNKNLPWVDDLVPIMHQLLDLDQKKANEAFENLLKLRLKFPNINEINYLIGRIHETGLNPEELEVSSLVTLFKMAVKKFSKSKPETECQIAAPFYMGCSPDYSPSLSAMSYFYATGLHGETNHPLALKLLKEAIFKDGKIRDDAFPVALFNYGCGLYDGKIFDQIKVTIDKKQGFDLMLKAADLGYPLAQGYVGDILCKEGSEKAHAKGIRYLQLAARQDEPQSATFLLYHTSAKARDAVLLLNSYVNERNKNEEKEKKERKEEKDKKEVKFSIENFKNIIPFLEAVDILVKLKEKYPTLRITYGSLNEDDEVIAMIKNALTRFKAEIFMIKDVKERNEAITKFAEWGDRDCQLMLGLMYEGKNPSIMLIPEGQKPDEVTLAHKKSRKRAIAHYEHFVEKEQTLVPAIQLAFFLEYGLGKNRNPDLMYVDALFAELLSTRILTEIKPSGELSLEEQSEMETKKEDAIEMAQLNGDLLKAFDYYRKSARAYSPDYLFSTIEGQKGLCSEFMVDVNYKYFHQKLNKLAHVVQVRREVADALDSCGITLQVSGRKTDPVDLIANYHGIEGYQLMTDKSQRTKRRVNDF